MDSRVARHSEPEHYKKGQERSDQNRSWRDRAGLAYDAPVEAEDTDIARAVPPATELSPEPL